MGEGRLGLVSSLLLLDSGENVDGGVEREPPSMHITQQWPHFSVQSCDLVFRQRTTLLKSYQVTKGVIW